MGGSGALGGPDGADGTDGDRRSGGEGGPAQTGPAKGGNGAPAAGGQATGWWDDDTSSQNLTDTEVIDGIPGEIGLI